MDSENRLITYRDLIAVRDAILAEIKQINKGQPAKKWIKSKDVRKLLNISAGTLQTMRNNNVIPFTRVGGVIYYDQDGINEYLSSKSNKDAKENR